jgi:hypothetical protein
MGPKSVVLVGRLDVLKFLLIKIGDKSFSFPITNFSERRVFAETEW